MLARLARKSTSSNRVAFQRWFASFPPHEILPMAALSPTMEFGGVARWVKQEGESIIAGDIVAEIETDKATIDFEAQDDSFLAKILVPSGSSDVPVGTPLAITVEEESDISAFANATSADFGMETAGPPPTTEAPPTATPPPPPPSPVAAAPAPAAAASVAVAASSGGRVFASPAARRVARENGISVNSVGSGSGPNGRIITTDVESFLLSGGSSRGSMGAGVDFAHTATRHSIAERLTRAKQEVPHYYLTVDVDLTEVMRMRDQLKKERAMNISVHDFVLKASASAMAKVPDVNASWMDSFIRQFAYVDVNVAVNTERGLVMPIVKNLQSTSLLDLSTVCFSFSFSLFRRAFLTRPRFTIFSLSLSLCLCLCFSLSLSLSLFFLSSCSFFSSSLLFPSHSFSSTTTNITGRRGSSRRCKERYVVGRWICNGYVQRRERRLLRSTLKRGHRRPTTSVRFVGGCRGASRRC